MTKTTNYANGYQSALNDIALCAAQGPERVREWLLANLADEKMRTLIQEVVTSE